MIATVVLVLRIAFTIALYIFLAWALSTIVQELHQQGTRLANRKMPGITLFVKILQGVESQRYFSEPEVRIGRDTNCDLSMMDETMSAHHARVMHHHGQWWLEDLNSTNGTFLNGEKLNIPAVIITGDEFKCGNTFFRIRLDGDEEGSQSISF